MSRPRRRNGSRRIVFLVLAALIGVLASAAAGGAASFQPLGLGPGGVQSFAWDVSADGSVVVGTSWVQDGPFFPPHAVRWVSGTVQDLGALNPNAHEAQALAVSDDGSKVVGWARGTSGFQRPFLWSATGGMQELANVPGSDAIATDISRDGSVIVGQFYVDAEGSWHAFRWSGGVVTDLGFLPGGRDSKAGAVCGLGAAIVGSTVDSTTIQRAFRWRASSGMQNLGGVGKNSLAYAEGCSDDGNVVAGTSMDDKGNLRATRWDATGPHDLGTLGGNSSEAHAISSDGAVVVGGAGLPFVNGISEFSAFRWTTATGKIEQLSRVLQNTGVTTPFCHAVPCPAGTWFLQLALGISADGSAIVGYAIDPNGAAQAYRAVLPASGGGGSCAAGFTQVTLTVATAPGAAAGSVSSKQNSSNGSPLVVSSGQTGSACFQANTTLLLQADNQRIADWSGNPAITCKNGNLAQNQCEFLLGTVGQTVTATLK